MNCKDCIYFKRCVVLGVELDMHHDKEADKNCRHFKNKTDFKEIVPGKWEKDRNKRLCSVCQFYYFGTHKFNFCPHCGAKMDKE